MKNSLIEEVANEISEKYFKKGNMKILKYEIIDVLSRYILARKEDLPKRPPEPEFKIESEQQYASRKMYDAFASALGLTEKEEDNTGGACKDGQHKNCLYEPCDCHCHKPKESTEFAGAFGFNPVNEVEEKKEPECKCIVPPSILCPVHRPTEVSKEGCAIDHDYSNDVDFRIEAPEAEKPIEKLPEFNPSGDWHAKITEKINEIIERINGT